MPQNVILLSDVPGLGQVGDTCKVKDGYARNYLLPERLAVMANKNNINRFEKQKEKILAAKEKQLKAAQELSEKVAKVGLVFERPVGLGGRLFGSVTPYDIVAEFTKQDATVEKKCVLMHAPIKTAGDHSIRVRLHSKVVVDVPVKVIGIETGKDLDAGLESAPAKEDVKEEAKEEAKEESKEASDDKK